MKKIVLGVVFLFGLVLLAAGCSPGVSQGEYDALVSELNDLKAEVEDLKAEGEAPPQSGYASVKLGETFEFDGLEITFGKTLTEGGLYYESSPQESYNVIEIPVTITNHSGKARLLNSQHISAFGPGDVPLAAVPSADFEGVQDIELAGGESLTGKLYIRKKGTGVYSVRFDNGSEGYELRIRIRN